VKPNDLEHLEVDKGPNVVLIEDETVFRQLLRRTLEKRKGWHNIRDYADGKKGLDGCLAQPPDLLLVDLNLPGLHGLEIIKQLGDAEPNVRMLVLTGQADPKLPAHLIRLGVAGFVDKTAPLSYVLQAIDTVMAGGMFFAANITADPGVTPAEELPHASEVPPTILTQREVEVARLVARGRSSKEIASDLNLSTRTVEKHRANIMDKIQVREVASLVRWCMQNGLG
jgi:DNA-binding NarL/FixJ family response regulator